MMHPDKIKELILAGMTCEHLALDGDGQHFAVSYTHLTLPTSDLV